MKANKKWWYALIPFYNLMIFSEISMGSVWFFLLYLIPGVNIIVFFIMMYKLGVKFGYNGFLTSIFFIIYIPLLAFNTSLYNKINYIDKSNDKAVEKEYHYKKILFFIIVLSFIISLGFLIYGNYAFIFKNVKELKTENYIRISKSVVEKVSDAVEKGQIICSDGATSIINGENYYFYSNQVSEDFGIRQISISDLEISVHVFNNNGNYTYLVSLSNGNIGFKDVIVEEINKNSFLNYDKILDVDFTKSCSVLK